MRQKYLDNVDFRIIDELASELRRRNDSDLTFEERRRQIFDLYMNGIRAKQTSKPCEEIPLYPAIAKANRELLAVAPRDQTLGRPRKRLSRSLRRGDLHEGTTPSFLGHAGSDLKDRLRRCVEW